MPLSLDFIQIRVGEKMWSSDLFQAHPRNTGGGSAGPRALCWRTNQVAVKDDIQRDSLPSPSQNVTFILSCLQRSSRELLNIVQKATDNRSKACSVCEEAAQPLAESSCSRGTPEKLTQAACEKLTSQVPKHESIQQSRWGWGRNAN